MIAVSVHTAHRHRRAHRDQIARAVRAVLRGEGVLRGQVAVVFISDRMCRTLNRRFLGHDYPTDVISFPLGAAGAFEGEVYVNLDRAHRQARTYAVTPAHETARLVIHGVLHIAGYDDRTPAQARRMHAREDVYLARTFRPRSGTGKR